MIVIGLELWHILIGLLTSVSLILWYLSRNFNYWSKRGLKGPKPLFGFGTLLYSVFKTNNVLELKWYKKYGKLYGVFRGNKPVLTIADPELIKLVLVKDFNNFFNRAEFNTEHQILDKTIFFSRGDDWKRIRSIVSPTFTSGKLKKMYPSVSDCVNQFIDHLESYAKDGKDIDLKEVNSNFTIDVIAKCAFATQINAYKDPNNEFHRNGKKILNFSFKWIIVLIFPKFINNLLNITSPFDESANQFFFNITRHVLNTRRNNNNVKHNDFTQLLMDAEMDKESARDVIDVNEAHYVNEGEEELKVQRNAMNINVINKHLSENEILAQAWIFFIAGHESTASTLSFCFYELALNPECQQTLYEEICSAIDSNGDLSYETLSKLPYLDSVLSETLRLYPLAIRLEREAENDYKLGDTGVTLYKGQLIEIPVYAIHHSEEYYPNPHKFIPERFLPENRDQMIPYTYLPFGSGPRNCIGMRFALMESKLCLAQIVRRFRFVRSPNTEVPLTYKKLSPMIAVKSLIVGIEKRSNISNS